MSRTATLARTRPRVTALVTAVIIAVAYLALLIDKTLTGTLKEGQPRWSINLVPFSGITDAITLMDTWDAIVIVGGNALMLAPIAIGLLVTVRRFRPWLTLAVLAGTSILIEVLQLVLSTGRATDIDDVILNAGGGLAVYLVLAKIWPRLQGCLTRYITRTT